MYNATQEFTAMTPEEARKLLQQNRGRGRPPADLSKKIKEAKKVVAKNPQPLTPKRTSPKTRRNPIATPLKRGRPKGSVNSKAKPKKETGSSSPVSKRGRPKGSSDSQKRKTKVTEKTKKKNKYVEFPLAEYLVAGVDKLTQCITSLSDKDLRRMAGLTVKKAKEIVTGERIKGRPSVMVTAKRIVAEEIVGRSSKARGKKGSTAPAKVVGRKTRLRTPVASKEPRDKFRLKRRRGGGRARKPKKPITVKALPKKKPD